jgi:hypothetical protein
MHQRRVRTLILCAMLGVATAARVTLEASTVVSGFSRTAVVSGFNGTAVVSGFSRTAVVSGFNRTAVVSGFSRTAVVSGFSRTDTAQQAQPAPPATTKAPPPHLTISRVSTPPTLDEYADGEPRAEEAAVTQFFQREPGDGVPVSQQTEAYLSYDSQNLYVVFVAHDRDPGSIRANMTKREAMMSDDIVGIVLDTFHDRHRGYEFFVNPLGVQADAMFMEGQNDDFSFDTLWHSEGRLTAFGYVALIAIPFRSLRFRSESVQEWGVTLLRAIPRNNETSFWPYLTRRVTGFAQQMATLDGIRDVSPGRNLQFIPYAAFTGARVLDGAHGGYDTARDGRAGIDGKVIVKDAFAIDATFNPDFSQVESDEPQVTINQRFEVFFPEKRPFFIENASFFQTPFNLFHSRRIADPQFGARVTGRRGHWVIAGLGIDDREPGRQVTATDPAFGDRTGIGVVRIQRELPKQSNFGILATERRFGPNDNQIVSMDTRWKLNDHWVATGQGVYSRTSQPNSPDLQGPAFTVDVGRNGRELSYGMSYQDIAADFRAPLGFVQRVDIRKIDGGGGYSWYRKHGPIVSFGPHGGADVIWSHGGTLEEWESEIEFGVELKGQTGFEGSYSESMERFEGVEFRKHGWSIRGGTAWFKWLDVSTDWSTGPEINYHPAAGLRPFLADQARVESTATVKPLSALRIDETYLFTRLTARSSAAATPPGTRIVANHIWRTRASYQFTREWSLRAILDYNAVLPDRGLIALTNDKRFAADLLVTYLVNPWTAIYVGYNDGYENLAFDPGTRDGLRRIDRGLNSTGRQLFVKASYLFRF